MKNDQHIRLTMDEIWGYRRHSAGVEEVIVPPASVMVANRLAVNAIRDKYDKTNTLLEAPPKHVQEFLSYEYQSVEAITTLAESAAFTFGYVNVRNGICRKWLAAQPNLAEIELRLEPFGYVPEYRREEKHSARVSIDRWTSTLPLEKLVLLFTESTGIPVFHSYMKPDYMIPPPINFERFKSQYETGKIALKLKRSRLKQPTVS